MSYELFEQNPALFFLTLLISLVITVSAYCAIPLIMAAAIKQPITKKKYRSRCYGFNVIVLLLFTVLNNGKVGGAPYLMWTSVFMSVGLKILDKRGMLIDGNLLADDPNRIVECKSCGYKSQEYFEACPQCGRHAKQYIQEVITESATQPEVTVRFCRNCGEKLLDSSKFCRKCGTAVIDVPQ